MLGALQQSRLAREHRTQQLCRAPRVILTKKNQRNAVKCVELSHPDSDYHYGQLHQLFYVSSNELQSTLSGCSSSFSTTSGCFITGTSTAITVDFPMPLSTNTADDDIIYDRAEIYCGQDISDVPDYVSDSYIADTGIGPPSEPSRGDLVCAAQSSSAPSFIQANALVRLSRCSTSSVTDIALRQSNVMGSCAGGLVVSGPPKTKEYVQPTGGSSLHIEAIHVDDGGACFPEDTVNWDEDRCKLILSRPIFECEPESNPQNQIGKYGKKFIPFSQPLPKTYLTATSRRHDYCGLRRYHINPPLHPRKRHLRCL